MSNEKRPKWDISATITAAANAYNLSNQYKLKLANRLQPTDLETLKAGGEELSNRHSGQSEKLTSQKSKTLGKSEVIGLINDRVISLHGIVKTSPTLTPEIHQAFGIGDRLSKTADSVKAAANKVLTAYAANKEWSNKAGIIEADITEINDLLEDLTDKKEIQGSSVIVRKLGTMEKSVLQRTVEDLVSKISAIGIHVFAIENPAVAKLFADLIPSSDNGDKGDNNNGTDGTK